MANLFQDFLKPFTSGLAAPAPSTTNPSSPFYNPPAPINTAPPAPNQSTAAGAVYKAPPSTTAKTTTPATAAPVAPVGGSNVTLPNGAPVAVSAQGNIVSAPSSFTIDTTKPITSAAFGSNVTNTDVQSQYAQYVKQLSDAYKPTQDYLSALAAVQSVKARDAELTSNLLTGNAGGDTQGYAEGRTARQKGLNSIEGLRAEQALAVQEMIRSGNIEAAKALVQGAAPRDLSYGQVAYDPTTGMPIATGQTQPSYSASASPFGGYLVFDQRTGSYSVVGQDALTGGMGGGGGTQGGVPAFLQAAVGEIAGVQYIDLGKVASNQIPYAQQIAAQTGIPLLSTEDANKIQEAQATYTGAVTLLDTIANSAMSLITAETTGEAVAQAARLNARALLPASQERLYVDTKKAFLSMLTRAAGEKGVLTDIDVQRIEKALPTFLDTRSTAAQKQQQLRTIFDSQVQGAISAYLGTTMQSAPAGGGQIDMSAYAF